MEEQQLPVVDLVGLDLYYDKVPVLTNVNFKMHPSEFVYLVGFTGSGKSTFLKCLYGAQPVKRGKAFVTGVDLSRLKPSKLHLYRRQIGMVFQDFKLLPDLTAADNLNFVLRATRFPKNKRESRIKEVLEWVGLEHKIKAYPPMLSGGEQQRLSIARAILNNPAVIIADEPTGNLDPFMTDEIMYLFNRLNKEMGTAILLATHDYRVLDKFPSRIVKLEAGELKE
ncbi:MAG: ATP-binding cassette domain-containing protein [Saprospirales bacterium]|nr:MAG: ATP-binding cassette domain-containing protein [Saprospirales bacterium]